MSRSIALRGAIVALLVAPGLEVVNRVVAHVVTGIDTIYVWWYAPLLAIAAGVTASLAGSLEGRRPLIAFPAAVLLCLAVWFVADLQSDYADAVLTYGSFAAGVTAVKRSLEHSWASPWSITLNVLRGGLAIAWVTLGRARWPGVRWKPLAVAVAGSLAVTFAAHGLASKTTDFILAGGDILAFDAAAGVVIALALVLAAPWADALDRRLARAE